MSADFRQPWELTLCQPNNEKVRKQVPVPQSLDELYASLGVEPGHSLLTPHHRFPEQTYVVERLDQIGDGATLQVQAPKKRIFISVPPHIKDKAVVWYPGATVAQIERSIARAAGLPDNAAIELRDGDDVVVLSPTIPNDIHLWVVNTVLRPSPATAPRERPQATGSRVLNSSRGQMSSVSSVASTESRAKMQQSPSNHSMSGQLRRDRERQRDKSPPRQKSPPRPARSGGLHASVGGSTTPTAHQSAPEEHCVHILAGHTGSVLCLCGVGDILFTGSQDGDIMIWDLNNLQYIGTLPGHKGFVKCLYASYAKKVLCSGSQDRTIRVWSLETFSTVKTLLGHTGGVNAILILEGADVLVSGSEDRSIRVWDLATFEAVACLEAAHLGGVFALDRFGSPLQVVSGARDRSLKVWNASTWAVSKTLHPPHYDGVTSIAVAGKHGKFYSGSRDRSIKEWDVQSLTNTMHTLHVHGDWIQALCMSPSDDVLFSGSKDGVVKVWDGELQCQDVLQGHRGPVSALTAVGNRLFSASHDRAVRVWRIEQYG